MQVIKNLCLALVVAFPAGASARLVDDLMDSYDPVETVSCEVRRTSRMQGRKMKALSRVHYQRPDHIHVDSRLPIKRRHVADGERMYYYVQGDPKGFSRPIEELDEEWLISLRKVPGTAMDHLMRIGAAEEDELEATAAHPVRRGYDAQYRGEEVYVVLSMDPDGRLQTVEYFETPARQERILTSRYKDFEEVLPGVSIPRYHETEIDFKGLEREEDVQFLNLEVNQPVAPKLFDPSLYFEDVEFVDSFGKIYN